MIDLCESRRLIKESFQTFSHADLSQLLEYFFEKFLQVYSKIIADLPQDAQPLILNVGAEVIYKGGSFKELKKYVNTERRKIIIHNKKKFN